MSTSSNIAHFTRGVINLGNVETFNKLVHEFRDNLIITTFSSPTCSACKQFDPIFANSQKKYAEKGVIFTKVDVTQLPEVAEQFQIMGTPTTIIIHQQKVKNKQVGLIPPNNLTQFLNAELSKL
jgi:thiol-disulfide isomerase/thioredoxin